MLSRVGPAAGLALALAALGGCGGPAERVPVYPTTGRLVRPGGSVKGLSVIFHPADGSAPTTPLLPTGVVNPDGTFAVTSYNKDDGAPPGEYVVVVAEAPRPDKVLKPILPRAKYLSPKTSPLRATIEAKPANELPPFDISP